MNALTTKLSQKQSLQQFLIKTIDYLQKYFKTITLQSQQKTYASINKICTKIQSKFPNKYVLQSLSKKLCLNIETKIKDKQDDVESSNKQTFNNKKKTISGMKSFITNIQSAIQIEPVEVSSPLSAPTQPPTRVPSTESEFSWIRKTVLQQLQLLKDDIRDADDKIEDFLENCIGKNQDSQKFVLLFESFLDNKSILDRIINLGWTPIIVRNQRSLPSLKTEAAKEGNEAAKKQQKIQEKEETVKEIEVKEVSAYLHKCQSLIISSDSITKTGGVLGSSGSLMLSLMARRRKVPVIVISRNYCLSDRILLGQKTLTTGINPSQHFKISHDDFGLYITKEEDYIDGKYIDLMITERGCWTVEEISHVQDQYWTY